MEFSKVCIGRMEGGKMGGMCGIGIGYGEEREAVQRSRAALRFFTVGSFVGW